MHEGLEDRVDTIGVDAGAVVANTGLQADAIAVGDGANDLPMMSAAGLSVAYHAKPRVREQAMVAIDRGGLDRLLEIVTTP